MKMLFLTLLLLSVSGLSQARSWKHNNHNDHNSNHNQGYFWQEVESRRHKQHRHIDHGIETGQLTRREIKKLKRERKHVNREIKHYRRHNYLSHSNKSNILRHLDHYSDQIYHFKQNKHYSRRRHHNHQKYSRHNNYRNNRNLSWANNNYSSGLNFRF